MQKKFKPRKLKKQQLYYMSFNSGYREYFSFGTDLDVMASNLLKRYNRYCTPSDKIRSLEKLARIANKEDYSFHTYIVDINSASDMDYRDFNNEIYLGDYLKSIRDKGKKGEEEIT